MVYHQLAIDNVIMSSYYSYNLGQKIRAQYIVQICGNYLEGKANCPSKGVADDFLQRMTIEVINSLYASNGDVIRIVRAAIDKVIKSSDDVNLILENKLKEREQLEQKLSELLDMKLAKSFDVTTLEKKYKDTTNRLSELLTNIDELENKYKNVRENDDRLKRIDQFMEEHKDGITELNSQVLQSFFRIMIMTDDKLMTYVISLNKLVMRKSKKIVRK